jgi:hypothetical protein
MNVVLWLAQAFLAVGVLGPSLLVTVTTKSVL